MLSNRLLIRALSSTSRALAQPSRSYFTAPRPTSKPLPQTPAVKIPKAPASTTAKPGAGNPEIIDTLPTTANEIDVEATPEVGAGNDAGAGNGVTDWSKSYHGLSTQAFSKDIAEILLSPIDPLDVEMKPGSFCRASMRASLISWWHRRLNLLA